MPLLLLNDSEGPVLVWPVDYTDYFFSRLAVFAPALTWSTLWKWFLLHKIQQDQMWLQFLLHPRNKLTLHRLSRLQQGVVLSLWPYPRRLWPVSMTTRRIYTTRPYAVYVEARHIPDRVVSQFDCEWKLRKWHQEVIQPPSTAICVWASGQWWNMERIHVGRRGSYASKHWLRLTFSVFLSTLALSQLSPTLCCCLIDDSELIYGHDIIQSGEHCRCDGLLLKCDRSIFYWRRLADSSRASSDSHAVTTSHTLCD